MSLINSKLSTVAIASIIFVSTHAYSNEIRKISDIRSGPFLSCKISNLATSSQDWFEKDGELLLMPKQGRGSNVMSMMMRGSVAPLWANLAANFIEKEKNNVIRIYGEKADRNSAFMMINLASGYGTFVVSNKTDSSDSDYGPREIYVNLNMHDCNAITYDQAIKLEREMYDFVETPEFKKSLIPAGITVVETHHFYEQIPRSNSHKK